MLLLKSLILQSIFPLVIEMIDFLLLSGFLVYSCQLPRSVYVCAIEMRALSLLIYLVVILPVILLLMFGIEAAALSDAAAMNVS